MLLAFVIFSFAVLLVSFVESLVLYIWAFCLLVVGLFLLRCYFSYSWWNICIYLVLFLLPVVSVFVNYRTYEAYVGGDWPQITTWTILSTSRPSMYVYATTKWKALLVTDELLHPWDIIQAYWSQVQAHQPRFFLEWTSLHIFHETNKKNTQYTKRLYIKWYRHVFYAKNVIIEWKASLGYIDYIRYRLIEQVRDTYGISSASWLLAWMYIWDISTIRSWVYDTFIDSGLVHIVAVSGSNIYMLVCFLHLLLFFLPYYMRVWSIMVCICVYAFLCGADSSIMRALIMWLITFVSLVGWFPVRIWRVCLYAYVVLLTLQPFSLLYDLWFWLSFLALWWIVLLDKLIRKRMGNPHSLFNKLFFRYILPSVGATRWVLPLLLSTMWHMNVTSVLWNLFVLPFLPLIMVWWAIPLLPMSGIDWSVLSSWVIYSLDYIIFVARMWAKWNINLSIHKSFAYLIFLGIWCLVSYRMWTATHTSISDEI